MLNVSNAGKRLSSTEAGLFNHIALFSACGLVMSMAFVLAGGVTLLNPWL